MLALLGIVFVGVVAQEEFFDGEEVIGGAGVELEEVVVEGLGEFEGEQLVHDPARPGVDDDVEDLHDLRPVVGDVEGAVLDLVMVFVVVELGGFLLGGLG